MLQQIVKIHQAASYKIGGPLIHIIWMTERREAYAAMDESALSPYRFRQKTFVLSNLFPFYLTGSLPIPTRA